MRFHVVHICVSVARTDPTYGRPRPSPPSVVRTPVSDRLRVDASRRTGGSTRSFRVISPADIRRFRQWVPDYGTKRCSVTPVPTIRSPTGNRRPLARRATPAATVVGTCSRSPSRHRVSMPLPLLPPSRIQHGVVGCRDPQGDAGACGVPMEPRSASRTPPRRRLDTVRPKLTVYSFRRTSPGRVTRAYPDISTQIAVDRRTGTTDTVVSDRSRTVNVRNTVH